MTNEKERPSISSRRNTKMKKCLAVVMITGLIICGMSCAGLSKTSLRSFLNRTYNFCGPEDLAEYHNKLCYTYCKKFKWYKPNESKNCEEWKTDVKDLSNKETFERFRNGGFVVIVEERID